MHARTLLRSPLLHFFALGGLVFAAYWVMDDSPADTAADAIVLEPAQATLLAEQFEETWNRPPSRSEMEGLMRSWALEEANVREAITLGLDQHDPVIRQRLSMKMDFIAESGASALVADDATLQAHLEAHADRFETPGRLAFEQVLLPERQPDAERILRDLENGADPAALSSAALLPTRLPMTATTAIDRMFGTGFAATIAEVAGIGWSGPVQSGYGQHLVRVTERAPAELPELSAIRTEVEQDWRAARARDLKERFGKALLERYEVTLPPADEVLAR